MIDRQAILAATEGEVRFDEPMRLHTTFRIGGPADALAFPTTVASVQRLVVLARKRGWPTYVLGAGSNLLVRDGGVRGLVVSTTRLRGIEWEEGKRVRCEAGAMLPALLAEATRRGLAGLECLAGVPGTVGGAVVMNAGTRTTWIGERVEEVTVVTQEGALETRPGEACGFRYRGSDLRGCVVVSVRLGLRPEAEETIRAAVASALAERRYRQPQGIPCAGSVFKNPPGDAAGRLIEAAGMKGKRLGGAEVSPVHANFIVNRGEAKATDVLGLMSLCQERVAKMFGVTLEPEICIVGEERG